MEQCNNAYQAVTWHILQTEGIVLPADTVLKAIVIQVKKDAIMRPHGTITDTPDRDASVCPHLFSQRSVGRHGAG